ncbi:flagellar motor switch phosphatase FliY [Virgibacillus alimentarius]|uniref:Flagellar motor switch protein FliN/FliY n=1 Tax=Virgibacillus alimentarius TaxID=698769 RepID=A0ABS4S402_9BACI|nr:MULTISPECIES: flagellar motor switch phosphatase FliY [Virgibacillus]MBP2256206.1 flagellar motor switch protein FliN/FliY [Virgibacillus alimentarius]HLR66153.1 flagellar motor switch phosphatase FliY [Virgibacillus sp.]
MPDNTLSQDEIDALLEISSDKDENGSESNVGDYLSTIEIDTLGEIGNISFGSSATTLSTLLKQKVAITTPVVSIINKEEIYEEFSFEYVSIRVNYIEGFKGKNIFVIKSEDAAIISDIMLGGDGTSPTKELNDIHLSAVQEVMNQMMGAAATSMSTVFDKRVDISPPSIKLVSSEETEEGMRPDAQEEVFVKVSFQLKVGELIDSNIMQLIPIPFANELVSHLLHGPTMDTNNEAALTVEQFEKPAHEKPINIQEPMQDQEKSHTAPQYIGNAIDREHATIQQASFSEFNHVELDQNAQKNLDMLLDIPLNITVELGRTKRTIREILNVSSGSVIELDKLAGEPVDILVNGKLIAQGEVVVIDENFGVRVTDIISQTDRIMKLK